MFSMLLSLLAHLTLKQEVVGSSTTLYNFTKSSIEFLVDKPRFLIHE